MKQNYFSLKSIIFAICLSVLGYFIYVYYPDLSTVIGNVSSSNTFFKHRKKENKTVLENSHSLDLLSSIIDKDEITTSYAFEGELVLIKSMEDLSGNTISGTVDLGETFNYVINYINNSEEQLNNVIITDEFPELVTVVDHSPYNYDATSKILTVDIGQLAPGDAGEIKITVRVDDVENVRDNYIVRNQAFASYNDNLIQPSFPSVDEEVAKPTVFCLEVGEDLERTEVLCGNSIILTSGQGYDTYTWTKNGVFVANTSETEINEEGVYLVKKTVDCGGAKITHFETVNVYGINNISNPFVNYTENLLSCTGNGYRMPTFYLCNEGSTLTLESGFVDIRSIAWEKLNESEISGACPEIEGDWDEISNENTAYEISESGSYRIHVVFQNGCFKDFYFNVYDGLNPDIDVDNYTNYQLGSIEIDTQMDVGGEFTYTIEDSEGRIQVFGPTGTGTHTFNNLLEGTYVVTINSKNGCEYTETIEVKNENTQDVLEVEQVTGENDFRCDALVKVSDNYNGERVTIWSFNGEEIYDSFGDIDWNDVNRAKPTLEIDYLGEGEYVFVSRIRHWQWPWNYYYYTYVVSDPVHIALNSDFEFDVITENISCFNENDGSARLKFGDPNDERDIEVELYRLGGEKRLIDTNNSGIFENLPPGDYEVVVSIRIPNADEEGEDTYCPISKNFTITGPEARLNAYAGVVKDISCWQEGDSEEPASLVRITSVTGGVPPYEYSFDGVNWKTDSDRLGYMANDGDVLLRDAGGCELKLSVDVNTYIAPPTLDYSVAYDCFGKGTVTIDANVPENSGVIYDYSYSIENGIPQDSEVFEDLEPGNYEVTVYYENVNPNNPTPTLLMEEDFGKGENTTWDEVHSDYQYESNYSYIPDGGDDNGMLDDGEYMVTQQLIPRGEQEWLTNVRDPEEEGGRYLAINIGDVAGSGGVIYEKEIFDITPGTNIDVDLKVINLLYRSSTQKDPEIKAVLRNSSGAIVSEASAGVIENDEVWHDVNMTLNAGPNEILTLQLISYSTETSGNDIAIDGIKTYQKPAICASSIDMAITVDENGGFEGDIISQSETSCYDTADGTVTFVVRNIADPNLGYEYRYSNDGGINWEEGGWITESISEVTIDGLAGGDNILVQVRDVSNKDCSFELETEIPIQEPDRIELEAKVDSQVGCGTNNGGTIRVKASGGTGPYEYQLSDSNGILRPYQGQNIFIDVPAGQYTITVRDTNQCTEVAEDIVDMSEPIKINFIADAVECFDGTNGIINVEVTSGNGNYQFGINPKGETWNPETGPWFDPNGEDGTKHTFTNLVDGNYTLFVKDGYGCIEEQDLTINPKMNLIVSSFTNVSCVDGSNGEAEITIENLLAAPYSYSIDGTEKGSKLTGNKILLTGLESGTYKVVVTDNNGCQAEIPLTVQEPENQLELEKPIITPIKCSETGYTTASVEVKAIGGWGDFQYTLTYPDGTTSDLGSGVSYTFNNLDQIGTYNISVTDKENCTVSDTFELSHPTPPNVVANNTSDFCMDNDGVTIGFIITQGVAPYEYSRDNGNTWTAVTSTDGTFEITVNTSQTISVLVRDDNDCISPSSASVQISGQLTASANVVKGLDCSTTPEAEIFVTIEEGYEPYTYTVNNDPSTQTTLGLGENSFTYNPATEGTYTFNIVDAKGCVTTVEKSILTLDIPEIEHNTLNVSCHGGNDGQLIITPKGGTPNYSVHITGPNGFDQIFTSNGDDIKVLGLEAGTYTYTLTDGNNCRTNSKNATISEPVKLSINLDASDYTCNNEDNAQITATVSGGSGSYQFRVNGGNWSTSQSTTSFIASNLSDGTHTIDVRDAAAIDCFASASIPIKPLPEPPEFNYSVDYSCDGTGTVTVTPFNTDYTYTLDGNPPQDNSIPNHNVFTNVAVGLYEIRVDIGRECTTPLTVLIEEGNKLQATVTDVDNNDCYGATTGSITFKVINYGSSFSYSVNEGSAISSTTSEVIYSNNGNGLPAGDYTIEIFDETGTCSVTLSESIIQPDEALELNAVVTTVSRCSSTGPTEADITLTATGGIGSYEYRMDGGAWQGSNSFKASPGVPHKFEVMDGRGCIAEDDTPPTVEVPVTLSFDLKAIACYQGDHQGWIEIVNLTGNGGYEYKLNSGVWKDLPTDNIIPELSDGTHTIEIRDDLGCTSIIKSIVINPILSLKTEITDFGNCAGSMGSIVATAEVSGQSKTFEYAFVSSGATPSVSDWGTSNSLTDITSPGTYDVYVRYDTGIVDALGAAVYCQTMAPATVNELQAVSIDFDVNQPLCVGDKGDVLLEIQSGQAPYRIELINTDTNNTIVDIPNYVTPNEFPIDNLEPGNYNIKVTDRFGCIDEQPITINSPVALTAEIEPILPSNCVSSNPNDYGFKFVNYSPSTNVEFSDDGGINWEKSPVFTGHLPGATVYPVMRTIDGNENELCVQDFPKYTIPYILDKFLIEVESVINCNVLKVEVKGNEGFPPYEYTFTDNIETFDPNVAGWQPGSSTDGSFIFDENFGLIPGRSYTFFVKDQSGCIRQSDNTTLYDQVQDDIPILISGQATPSCKEMSNGSITFELDGNNLDDPSSTQISWELFDLNDQSSPEQTSNGLIAWPDTNKIVVTGLSPVTSYYIVVNTNGGMGPCSSTASGSANVFVDELESLEFTAAKERDINCVNPGLVRVNAEGGSGNYTYTLSSSNFKSDIESSDKSILVHLSDVKDTTDSPFDITVTVKDEYGCTTSQKTIQMSIAQPPAAPVVNVSQCNPSSTGATITVTSPAGGTGYQYSNDNGLTFQESNIFSGLADGVYNIVVLDESSGCTSTATKEVIYKQMQVDVSLSQEYFCSTDQAIIKIEVESGGSGEFQYEVDWLAGTGTDGDIPITDLTSPTTSIPVSNFGNYHVTITDKLTGCELNVFEVVVPPAEKPNFEIVASSTSDITCNGFEDGVITVRSLDNNDQYDFSITKLNDTPISGGPISPSMPSDGYTATFENLGEGEWTIEAISQTNGCATEIEEKIIEPDPITVPKASLNQAPFECTSGNTMNFAEITVDLGGVTGGSGNYTRIEFIAPDGTSVQDGIRAQYTVKDLAGGTYTVKVYDDNGCVGTQQIDIAPFVEISSPKIRIDRSITCTNDEDITVSVDHTGTPGTVNLEFHVKGISGVVYDQTNSDGIFTALKIGDYLITVTNTITGCFVQKIHTVSDPDTFELEAHPSNINCYGSNGGSVTLNLADQLGNYSGDFEYEITGTTYNGDPISQTGTSTGTSITVDKLYAGEYQVEANLVDAPFCIVVEDFNISQPNELKIVIEDVINENCHELGKVIVTAQGGLGNYEYSIDGTNWQSSGVFDLNEGMYTVWVKDIQDCISSVVPVEVKYDQEPEIKLLVNNVCGGEGNYEIQVDLVTPGIKPYTYRINGSRKLPIDFVGGVATITSLNSDDYTVEVFDANNCSATGDTQIEIYEPLRVDTNIIHPFYCTSNSAKFMIEVEGGSGNFEFDVYHEESSTYIRQNASLSTNPMTISVGDVGTYSIEVYDKETNCNNDTSQIIIDPIIYPRPEVLSVKDITCFGSHDGRITVQTNGTDSPYTFVLTELDGTSRVIHPVDSNGFQAVFEGLDKGEYTIEVISQKSGCSTFIKEKIEEPQPLSISAEITDSCDSTNGYEITVSLDEVGTAPYTLSVNGVSSSLNSESFDSNGNYVIPELQAGDYTIEIQDINGCTATASNSTLSIKPLEFRHRVTSLLDCEPGVGASAVITLDSFNGSGDYSYTIIGPNGIQDQGDLTVIPFEWNGASEFGDYTITIQDDIVGCSISQIVKVPQIITPELEIISTIDERCADSQDGQITVRAIDNGIGPFVFEITAVDGTTLSTPIRPTNFNGYMATFNGLSGDINGTNYTITATAANSCESLISQTLFGSDPITLGSAVNVTQFLCNAQGNLMTFAKIEVLTNSIQGGSGDFVRYEFIHNGIILQNGSDNELTFTDINGGVVTINVYDNNGCSGTQDVIINPFVSLEEVEITIDRYITCNSGQDITATVNTLPIGVPVNLQFTLEKPDGTLLEDSGVISNLIYNFTNLPSGSYFINVLNIETGCIIRSSHNVSNPEDSFELRAQENTRVVCYGTLTGSVKLSMFDHFLDDGDQSNDYSYTITGITNPSIVKKGISTSKEIIVSGLSAGIYEVSALINGNSCTVSSGRFAISQSKEALDMTIEEVANVTCSNDQGEIYVAPMGGYPPYEIALYKIDENSGTRNLVNQVNDVSGFVFDSLSSGLYEAVVVDNGGCEEVSSSLTLIRPKQIEAEIAKSDILCSGDLTGVVRAINITGGAGVGNYYFALHNKTTGTISETQESPVFNNLAAGIYEIVVMDAWSCDFTTLEIEVTEPNPIIIQEIGKSDIVCKGSAEGFYDFKITGGTAPYDISLTDRDSGKLIFNRSSNGDVSLSNLEGDVNYDILIQDASGCTQAKSLKIPSSVDLSSKVQVLSQCVGNVSESYLAVQLLDTNVNPEDVMYALNSQDINDADLFDEVLDGKGIIHKVKAGKDQWITIFYKGCNKVIEPTEYFTIEPLAPLSLTVNESNLNEFTMYPSGGQGPYEYFVDGVSQGSESSYVIKVSGVYEVMIIDANGCQQIAQIDMEFIDIEIPNVFTPNGDGNNDYWPPSNYGQFYPNIITKIYDRYGRVVGELRQGDNWDGRYNGTELPTGDYWYVMKLNGVNDDREFVGHFTLYR